MEKAYLITQNTNLKKLEKESSSYDRFYFGDSYCEYNLFYFLDDKDFIDKLLLFKKPLTLTTPIISNKNIDKLFSFIDKFKAHSGFEVVVNDYGVFHYLKEKYLNLELIWGNFLSGQNKDPFLKVFSDKETHKKLSIDNSFYKDFFKKNNISQIELYNTFQGLELKNSFSINLYYPYTVYSISRYCPAKLMKDNKNYLEIVENCRGCKNIDEIFEMELKMKKDFSKNFYIGNKQFYENKELLKNKAIKRIVYNYDLIG